MEVEFDDDDLDRLETDPRLGGGFPRGVVRAYRKALQVIRDAPDERDLYALKGLRFEKFSGKRSHQRSIRLNKQWRLIIELHGSGSQKVAQIVEIEDYHR